MRTLACLISAAAVGAACVASLLAPLPAVGQTASEQPFSPLHDRTGPAHPTKHNVWSRRGSGVTANGGGWSSIKLLDINRDGFDDLCGVYGPVPSLNRRIYACVLNTHRATNDDPNARTYGETLIRAAVFDGDPDESVHGTIGLLDMPDQSGTVHRHLCGRTTHGVQCQRFSAANNRFDAPATPWPMQSSFSNSNGWNKPEYYSTIAFVRIGGLPAVCGRSKLGVRCYPKYSFESGFMLGALYIAPSFSDANGWNQEQYFRTLRFVDVSGDGHADVCGRGVTGIWCAVWSPQSQQFAAPTRWTPQYADAHGWNQPQHFQTIRFADVNGDGFIDVCGRGNSGLICELGTGTHFVNAGVINQASFGDLDGWMAVDHFRSISLLRVDADSRFDVCGLNTDAGSTARQWFCALARPYVWHRWEPARFDASLTVRTGDVRFTEYPIPGRLHHGGKTGICWAFGGDVRCSNPWY